MGCGSSTTAGKNAKKTMTAAERKAMWKSVQKRLPREKTSEDKKKRITLFEKFDKNDTGKLSLDEVYVGCKDVLKLQDFTDHLEDIVKRAFNKARSTGTVERGEGSDDFVEFLEFRLFLCYIYDYFELTVMFDDMDTNGNQLLSQQEFVEGAPKLREFGITVADPEAEFKSVDVNGSGAITFDEFAEWATAKKTYGDPDEGVVSPQRSPQAQQQTGVLSGAEEGGQDRELPTASAPAALTADESKEAGQKEELPAESAPAALTSEETKEAGQKDELPTESAAPALTSGEQELAGQAAAFPTDQAQPLLSHESEDPRLEAAEQQAPQQASRDVVLEDAQPMSQKTAAERKIAWERIRARLPRAKTPEDKTKRIALFKQFDRNKKKALTLDDCYNGCVNILNLDDFTPMVRDINKRAFAKASGLGNAVEGTGDDDKVEFLEFRLFLCFIYDYFELTVMFDEMDESGDMMVDREEFHAAIPKIAEWGLQIDDADAVFNSIDKNGTGKVSFDEFAQWAASKKLDAEGK